MPWIAAATIGSGLLSAGSGLFGAGEAASSADKAAQLQAQMYATTRADLRPYNLTGQSALGVANAIAGGGRYGGGPDYLDTAYSNYMPGTMTQAQLEQTPGYQFNLSQGLKAMQSAAAARGLGVSGASLKGAGTYASGLASNTYQQQFQNQQQQFSNLLNLNTGEQANIGNEFGRLQSLASLGENAAAQTGSSGTQAAATGGNYLNQAGLASAAGISGVGNAATGVANNLLALNAYNARIAQPTPQLTGFA